MIQGSQSEFYAALALRYGEWLKRSLERKGPQVRHAQNKVEKNKIWPTFCTEALMFKISFSEFTFHEFHEFSF